MTARLHRIRGALAPAPDRDGVREEVRLVPNAALWEWRGAAGLAELVGWMLDARPRPRIDVTLDLGRRAARPGAPAVSVPELGLSVTHGTAEPGDSLLAAVAPYLAAALRWAEAVPTAARGHSATVVRAYGPAGDLVADVLAVARPGVGDPRDPAGSAAAHMRHGRGAPYPPSAA